MNYIPDIDELITLRRREGVYSSAQQFVQQIASALAVSLWGVALSFSGFITTAGGSDTVVQPVTVPITICVYMLIGCAGFFILSCILGSRIHIDKKQCDILCAAWKMSTPRSSSSASSSPASRMRSASLTTMSATRAMQ